jgi:dTDP-4-amino-4,6-dideoxygalactose transaminase
VIAPGYKYNMPDVNAAIGLAQLERAEEMRKERERCARYYMENLADLDSIDLPLLHINMEDHAWHLFVIVLKQGAKIGRDEFIGLLAERGIGTSVHYKPLHRMKYYRETYDLKFRDFPDAERMWVGCVSLPIYPSLDNEDLEYVCSAVRDILA